MNNAVSGCFWHFAQKIWEVAGAFVVADLRGAPPGQKFSKFHAVFRKNWQNRMLAPPPTGNTGSAPALSFYECRLSCRDIMRW